MSNAKSWFGPTTSERWAPLAQEIQATFHGGDFWNGCKVVARHGHWMMTLDSYTVLIGKVPISYTRMRAPFVNRDRLRCEIYNRGVFSGLGKWFGMQDIAVGHQPFDEQYIIKGNDAKKIAALLASPRLRELIEAQSSLHLLIRDDDGWFGTAFPPSVDELYFQVQGLHNDIESLKTLFELFAEALDQLCRIGAAEEEDPQVKL